MNAFIIIFGSAIWLGMCDLLFRLIQIRKDIKILIDYKYTPTTILKNIKAIYSHLNETKDTHKRLDSIIEQLRDIELLLENEEQLKKPQR